VKELVERLRERVASLGDLLAHEAAAALEALSRDRAALAGGE